MGNIIEACAEQAAPAGRRICRLCGGVGTTSVGQSIAQTVRTQGRGGGFAAGEEGQMYGVVTHPSVQADLIQVDAKRGLWFRGTNPAPEPYNAGDGSFVVRHVEPALHTGDREAWQDAQRPAWIRPVEFGS